MLTLLYLAACVIARVSGLSRRWQSFRFRVGGPDLSLTVRAHRYQTVTRLEDR